jgi:hypothetical protein
MAGLRVLCLYMGVGSDVGTSLRAAQAVPQLLGWQKELLVLDVVMVCVELLVASQPYTVAQVDSTLVVVVL